MLPLYGAPSQHTILFPPQILQYPLCSSLIDSRSRLRLHVLEEYGKRLRQLYAWPESMSVHFSKCSARADDLGTSIIDPTNLQAGQPLSAGNSTHAVPSSLTGLQADSLSSDFSGVLASDKITNTNEHATLPDVDSSSQGSASPRLPIIGGSVAAIHDRHRSLWLSHRKLSLHTHRRLQCTLRNICTTSWA